MVFIRNNIVLNNVSYEYYRDDQLVIHILLGAKLSQISNFSPSVRIVHKYIFYFV